MSKALVKASGAPKKVARPASEEREGGGGRKTGRVRERPGEGDEEGEEEGEELQ